MTQNQINREVANATGETVDYIRKLGFNLVIVPQVWLKPRSDGGQIPGNRAKQSKPLLTQTQPKAA